MIGPFAFDSDGRTYACAVEQAPAARGGAWWWFRVSGDGHRYAPFLAAAADTRESVRSRIVAYYTERLARRAAPSPPRGFRGRPKAEPAPAAEHPAEPPKD